MRPLRCTGRYRMRHSQSDLRSVRSLPDRHRILRRWPWWCQCRLHSSMTCSTTCSTGETEPGLDVHIYGCTDKRDNLLRDLPQPVWSDLATWGLAQVLHVAALYEEL